jgi:hypothetical protein
MVESVLHPVDYGSLREERRPTLADVLEDCVLPVTFKYVSGCPANDAAGKSSAVALERTT